MKKEYIKKLRHVQIIILVSLLSIYSLCGYLLVCNRELENNQANLTDTVQSMLKDDIRDGLNEIQIGLNDAISSGEVSLSSDKQITDWVMSHNSFKHNDKIQGISLVNIGYSAADYNSMKGVINGSDLSNEIKDEINNEFKTIDTDIDVNLLIEKIEVKSIELSEKYNMDLDNIRNTVLESVFTNNKILFSTTNYISDNNKMSYVINDDEHGSLIWVESISIPDGSIGFNDEPKILNNQPNYEFKKLILTVTVDATKVMEPYQEKSQIIATITNTISQIIIFIIIVTTILCFSTVMVLISKLNKKL